MSAQSCRQQHGKMALEVKASSCAAHAGCVSHMQLIVNQYYETPPEEAEMCTSPARMRSGVMPGRLGYTLAFVEASLVVTPPAH